MLQTTKLALTATILLFSVQPSISGGSFHWTYGNGDSSPAHWAEHFSKCGGSSQSPIDIVTSDVTSDPELGPMFFCGFDNTDGVTFEVSNTGHSLKVSVTSTKGSHKLLRGKLPGTYQLAQFHFHFGGSDDVGSEHTVDGKAYPMEVHFVFYDMKYGSFSEAIDKPAGLAVVGAFFELSDTDNEVFERVLAPLQCSANPRVTYKGDEAEIAAFSLLELLPNTDDYYRYSGSLTTPTCDESVVWTILRDTNKISKEQMQTMRFSLFENELGESPIPIVDNFRPTQPINGRFVYRSQ